MVYSQVTPAPVWFGHPPFVQMELKLTWRGSERRIRSTDIKKIREDGYLQRYISMG